ncbi:hypothetical protein ACGFJ7_13255 [Actinoplanes sp. NPDC048988]|uniref:hypothetical protein n=1 Tax=Actinoplanes sp. NPDC048988 TaxID=3363901 RepID=UPI003714764E
MRLRTGTRTPTRGRPRSRMPRVYADRRYRHDKYRTLVRELGITPVIARRGTEHGAGLGKLRWVVEQGFALPHWFRRLRIRWEIRHEVHEPGRARRWLAGRRGYRGGAAEHGARGLGGGRS